jgi:hypothetical protein
MFGLLLAIAAVIGALVGFFSASFVGAIVGALAGVGAYAFAFSLYLFGDHFAALRWSEGEVEELEGDFVRFFALFVAAIIGSAAAAWIAGASDAHSLAIGFATGGVVWVAIVAADEIDTAMRRRYNA